LLELAVQRKDFRTVSQLVRLGADINMRDEHGESVLEKAIIKQDFEFAESLITLGADINHLQEKQY